MFSSDAPRIPAVQDKERSLSYGNREDTELVTEASTNISNVQTSRVQREREHRANDYLILMIFPYLGNEFRFDKTQ